MMLKKISAVVLASVMVLSMAWTSFAAEAEAIPEEYTKVKVFEGTYGFGDAEVTAATNEEENIFYLAFECFDEEQILEGTVADGIVEVAFDLTGFVSGDAQAMWDDAVASENPWEAAGEGGETMERGEIPEEYTKAKIYSGTYGFGDAEVIAATNEDESAFYLSFECFDEEQILEGTVEDGIVEVAFDLTGFVSGDAQAMWDDAVAAESEWVKIADEEGATMERGEIPEEYTKAKVFEGTYGFGDAEVTAATNEDESAFCLFFECFDEEQILEGTVADGIVEVAFDLTGFVSGDAQTMWDDAVAAEAEWVKIAD